MIGRPLVPPLTQLQQRWGGLMECPFHRHAPGRMKKA